MDIKKFKKKINEIIRENIKNDSDNKNCEVYVTLPDGCHIVIDDIKFEEPTNEHWGSINIVVSGESWFR